MNLFAVAMALHILVAVMGVGLLGAIPLGARFARRAGVELSALAQWLKPLFRVVRVSLVLAVVTGVALEYAAGGVFHESLWFRASFALLVMAGVGQARSLSGLRRGLDGTLDRLRALKRIEYWGWTSAFAVSCIAVLMELKP